MDRYFPVRALPWECALSPYLTLPASPRNVAKDGSDVVSKAEVEKNRRLAFSKLTGGTGF
jgi:hypothetical protein